MNKLLLILTAMLVTAILICYSYTVPGNYHEKTKVYNKVLDISEECEMSGGTFDYQDMTCVRG